MTPLDSAGFSFLAPSQGGSDVYGLLFSRHERTRHAPEELIMRLTTTTNVSVDGVMQGLGGPDEDRRGGFERGGWAIPLLDTETGDYLNQVYGGAAAFLFGWRTYEIFAGSWGGMADASTSPIAAPLDSRPKYVA